MYNQAVELLKRLIEIPSFSGEENETATAIQKWLEKREIKTQRENNNIWALNKFFDPKKPSILLNSHHDTVRPNKAYTNDPFKAFVEGDKLFGLGSNDAGGSLVSLMTLFVNYYNEKNLNYNLILAATAEEENSGKKGLNSLLKSLPNIDFAVVGEPTEMQLAISEKGLLVIDGYAEGISGHAAHNNTENAIYNAMKDIDWIRNYKFSKKSKTLGDVKMSITQINAGKQHNVVPAICHFVIDIRVNEKYSNKEIFECIDNNTNSKIEARSFDNNSSSISVEHPIVKIGIAIGRKTYGSPTLSDQSKLSCPSLKLGAGLSTRSHTANEYIYLSDIKNAIEIYTEIFDRLLK